MRIQGAELIMVENYNLLPITNTLNKFASSYYPDMIDHHKKNVKN